MTFPVDRERVLRILPLHAHSARWLPPGRLLWILGCAAIPVAALIGAESALGLAMLVALLALVAGFGAMLDLRPGWSLRSVADDYLSRNRIEDGDVLDVVVEDGWLILTLRGTSLARSLELVERVTLRDGSAVIWMAGEPIWIDGVDASAAVAAAVAGERQAGTRRVEELGEVLRVTSTVVRPPLMNPVAATIGGLILGGEVLMASAFALGSARDGNLGMLVFGCVAAAGGAWLVHTFHTRGTVRIDRRDVVVGAAPDGRLRIPPTGSLQRLEAADSSL
ncbi:MAG: hypothetical protein H6737_07105 [Alphaproteobacteria bacterium]|nr:hypothetical protein [Alphaproteobacteria bacterium]